jgi:hypothetical protein
VRLQKKWSRRQVIDGLRKAYDSELQSKNPALEDGNKAVIRAAIKRFGSLTEALRNAGIAQRPKRVSRYQTKEAVLQAIQLRLEKGRSLRPSVVIKEDSALHRQACRLFEKPWLAVLKDNGIKHDSRNRWSVEAVIEEIQRLAREKAELNPTDAQARPGGLYDAARHYFGNWSEAVKAARIDPRSVYVNEKWSKERIETAIRELAMAGESLGYWNLRLRGFHSLITTGPKVFKKSWSRLVEHVLGRPSAQNIQAGHFEKEKAEQSRGSLSRQSKGRATSPPGVEVIVARR